jgi:hypothetical protein
MKKKRKCSICNTLGHNARTCPEKDKPIEQSLNVKPTSTLSEAKKKEKELGHSILAAQKKKVEREEINGLTPQKGLWVINSTSRKIAGKIVKVKRNGDIVWKSSSGASIVTNQQKIREEGYSYLTDLEPEMLKWKII